MTYDIGMHIRHWYVYALRQLRKGAKPTLLKSIVHMALLVCARL
jgi:hypothetical protein